jgi:chitodextrinase
VFLFVFCLNPDFEEVIVKKVILAVVLIAGLAFYGCGGGGGGGGTTPPTDNTPQASSLEGTWGNGTTNLTMMTDGTYQVDLNSDGAADSWGNYSNTSTQIVLQDAGGENACFNAATQQFDTGTYSYTIVGNTMTLVLVSDNCSGRADTLVASDWAAEDTNDSTPPSAPSGLNAQTVSTSQINLSWSAASDDTGILGYKVYENGELVATTNETVFSDVGLADGQTFCYTIVAFDAAGNVSGQTTQICASTTMEAQGDVSAPTTPSNLSATAISSSQINLSWSASTDDVGVSSYKIYRNESLLTTTAQTSLQDTGLSESTNYCYTVSAQDSAGNQSAQSGEVCAETDSGQSANQEGMIAFVSTLSGNVDIYLINEDGSGLTNLTNKDR